MLKRKVYGISDLHLDINPLQKSVVNGAVNGDPEGILLLAGDTAEVNSFRPRIKLTEEEKNQLVKTGELNGEVGTVTKSRVMLDFEMICAAYHAVYVIFGNHEYYHGTIGQSEQEFRELIAHIPNAHFLHNEVVEVDGLRIVASMLWTDMRNRDPMVMCVCGQSMNDYVYIDIVSPSDILAVRGFNPVDSVEQYEKNLAFVKSALEAIPEDDELVTIVMTHHAPCMAHANPQRTGGSLADYAYAATTFEPLIYDHADKVAVFFHGHTHDRKITEFEPTALVTHARGYYDKDFDPLFLVGPAE